MSERDRKKEYIDSVDGNAHNSAVKIIEKLQAECEKLEKDAKLVTPDQHKMYMLKQKIVFLEMSDSERNKQLQAKVEEYHNQYHLCETKLLSHKTIIEQISAENDKYELVMEMMQKMYPDQLRIVTASIETVEEMKNDTKPKTDNT